MKAIVLIKEASNSSSAASSSSSYSYIRGKPHLLTICSLSNILHMNALLPDMSKLKLISEDVLDEVVVSYQYASPSHFTFKIQSFSLLAKSSIEFLESGDFEAGGYKWKLLLYPNGNQKETAKGHVSLYLRISGTSSGSLPPGWEVNAVFRFFLFDHLHDKYLTFGDAGGRSKWFRGLKSTWGFSKLIPTTILNDPLNGHIVDDTCVFGAEVFVCKSSCSDGEVFSLVKESATCNHLWKIENLAPKGNNVIYSKGFTAGNLTWAVHLYPKGDIGGYYNNLSLYLHLVDAENLKNGKRVHIDLTLRVRDQTHARHMEKQGTYWFSCTYRIWGWSRFMGLCDFNDPAKGFLVKDTCVVEAEVKVLGYTQKSP